MKVAVMERMICHYRLAFYKMLAEELKKNGHELRVFYGIKSYKADEKDFPCFVKLPSIRFDVKIGGLSEIVVLLPSLFGALIRFKPDVMMVEDISAMPNCLTILIYSLIFKTPYVINGPGSIPKKEKRSKLKTIMGLLIYWFRKKASAFLGYSTYAKNYYAKYNAPCYVAMNSTVCAWPLLEYERAIAHIHSKYEKANEINIAFIGRLIPQKKVDLLIKTLAKLSDKKQLRGLIIGGGEQKDELLALSKELGINHQIEFYGDITDENEKMRLFMKTHLGVLPGLGGLAIQEMMRYGIPIITSWADGTEQDLVVEAGGGIFIDEMNVETLCASINQFLNMGTEEKIAMALKCIEIINDKYNVESMVKAHMDVLTAFFNKSAIKRSHIDGKLKIV